MSEEWGPWIDGTVPPQIGTFIRMKVWDEKGRGGMTHDAAVLGFDGEILIIDPVMSVARVWVLDRYRVRKPRALLDLIDLVENLPAPASPKVDA